jgi:hypothetical protein
LIKILVTTTRSQISDRDAFDSRLGHFRRHRGQKNIGCELFRLWIDHTRSQDQPICRVDAGGGAQKPCHAQHDSLARQEGLLRHVGCIVQLARHRRVDCTVGSKSLLPRAAWHSPTRSSHTSPQQHGAGTETGGRGAARLRDVSAACQAAVPTLVSRRCRQPPKRRSFSPALPPLPPHYRIPFPQPRVEPGARPGSLLFPRLLQGFLGRAQEAAQAEHE